MSDKISTDDIIFNEVMGKVANKVPWNQITAIIIILIMYKIIMGDKKNISACTCCPIHNANITLSCVPLIGIR